jgi:hypothetical protein
MPVFEVRPRFTTAPILVVADCEDDARKVADDEVTRLNVLQALKAIQNSLGHDLDETTDEMVCEVIVAVNTLQAMVTSLERRNADAFVDGTAARVLLDTVKDFLAGI